MARQHRPGRRRLPRPPPPRQLLRPRAIALPQPLRRPEGPRRLHAVKASVSAIKVVVDPLMVRECLSSFSQQWYKVFCGSTPSMSVVPALVSPMKCCAAGHSVAAEPARFCSRTRLFTCQA